MTRLLLSHNHNVSDATAPALSPEEFCKVFASTLPAADGWTVEAIAHPHWLCAVTTEQSPQDVGTALVNALVTYRQTTLQTPLNYVVLALGGLKTSPPTSNSPTALQPGEWGVDIVETPDSEAFLTEINWDTLAAARPADGVFNVMS
ncbi:MAG: DUF2656 domain-containing protein [Merismopedia sp. SIO2A8]|nr:DUF2656 domain-containing protein [Merismopedia sp. SIO2A8]